MFEEKNVETADKDEYRDLLKFLNDSAHDLFAQTDIDAGIHRMLRRVCDYFGADRAYIIENDYTTRISSNTYEVCAEGVSSEKENLRCIPFDSFQFWFESFQRDEYINIVDVDELGEDRAEEKELLIAQSIHSLLSVPLQRDRILVGFLGVDNPRKKNVHVDRLTSLGDYLLSCFMNRDNMRRIVGENDFYSGVLNHIPGGLGVFYYHSDDSLEYDFINDGFYDMLGTKRADREKYTGFSVLQSLHPDDTEPAKQMIRSAVNGLGYGSADIRITNDNGQYKWVNAKVRVIEKTTDTSRLYVFFSDIHQLKRTQVKLKAREKAMQMASTTGDILFWMYDIDKEEIRKIFCDNLYNGRKENVDKVPEFLMKKGLVHPDDIERFQLMYDRLKQDEDASECTVRLMNRKTGIYEWRQIHYTRLHDKQYLSRTAIGFGINVDSEQEVRQRYERESQLRREMIKSAVSYCLINLTQGIMEEYQSNMPSFNERKTVQTVMDETFRKRVLNNIFEEDCRVVNQMFDREYLTKLYQNGESSASMEYRIFTPEQGICWMRSSVTITERFNTKDIIAYIFTYNIDEKRKNQLAIEAIMDEEIESVVVIDVISKKARFAQIKADVESVDPHTNFDYDTHYRELIHSVILNEDMEACENFFYLDRLIEGLQKESVVKLIYRSYGKNGMILRKKVRAFYLDDTRNEIILIRRDITDLYEEEQRQKKALREAVEAANSANHAKSDFLSRMSHDMRTPLNAVLSFSSDQIAGDATEAELREYIGKIHASGDYLLGIINDVLDMSKIEQDKMLLNERSYAMSEFIKIVTTVIQDSCNKKNLDFYLECSDIADEWIKTDAVRFNQIFMNLLSNAVKFTPEGGKIELIAKKCNDGRIQRRRYLIRDNGIGMSEVFIPHAFDSFSQENENDREQNMQGTGLGLAIVKKIVTFMNGTISVQSEQGKGSEFVVELPVTVVNFQKTEQDTAINDSLEGMRVLLCEDNLINKEITALLLSKKGCIMDWACNGKVGVEQFAVSPVGFYQAILMDIRMPVMDGYCATTAIRNMKREDATVVPIIAMTADAFVEDEEAAQKVGMNAHLSKPIEAEVFYRTLAKFYHRHGD